MSGKELRSLIKYFSLISQVGLQFILTVLISGYIGYLIDRKFFHTGYSTILGILIGVIGGFLGVWKLISEAEKNSR